MFLKDCNGGFASCKECQLRLHNTIFTMSVGAETLYKHTHRLFSQGEVRCKGYIL